MKKNILITGASDGIGLAIANLFLDNGWNVIGTCREYKNNSKKYQLYKCDQSSLKDIESFSIAISGVQLNACVFNAGIARFSLLNELKEAEYDYVMNVNLKGTLFLLQKVLSNITEEGSVIFLGSTSHTLGLKGTLAYAASKAALAVATKVLANELSSNKIRVNIVSPGVIDTKMYNKFELPEDKVKKIKQQMIEKTKFKRLGTVSEVADLIYFLTSEKSKYITGQEFIIDGGLTTGGF